MKLNQNFDSLFAGFWFEMKLVVLLEITKSLISFLLSNYIDDNKNISVANSIYEKKER